MRDFRLVVTFFKHEHDLVVTLSQYDGENVTTRKSLMSVKPSFNYLAGGDIFYRANNIYFTSME